MTQLIPQVIDNEAASERILLKKNPMAVQVQQIQQPPVVRRPDACCSIEEPHRLDDHSAVIGGVEKRTVLTKGKDNSHSPNKEEVVPEVVRRDNTAFNRIQPQQEDSLLRLCFGSALSTKGSSPTRIVTEPPQPQKDCTITLLSSSSEATAAITCSGEPAAEKSSSLPSSQQLNHPQDTQQLNTTTTTTTTTATTTTTESFHCINDSQPQRGHSSSSSSSAAPAASSSLLLLSTPVIRSNSNNSVDSSGSSASSIKYSRDKQQTNSTTASSHSYYTSSSPLSPNSMTMSAVWSDANATAQVTLSTSRQSGKCCGSQVQRRDRNYHYDLDVATVADDAGESSRRASPPSLSPLSPSSSLSKALTSIQQQYHQRRPPASNILNRGALSVALNTFLLNSVVLLIMLTPALSRAASLMATYPPQQDQQQQVAAGQRQQQYNNANQQYQQQQHRVHGRGPAPPIRFLFPNSGASEGALLAADENKQNRNTLMANARREDELDDSDVGSDRTAAMMRDGDGALHRTAAAYGSSDLDEQETNSHAAGDDSFEEEEDALARILARDDETILLVLSSPTAPRESTSASPSSSSSPHQTSVSLRRRLIKRSGISDQRLAEIQMARVLRKQLERAKAANLNSAGQTESANSSTS